MHWFIKISFFEYIELAEKYELQLLSAAIVYFVVNNFEYIKASKEWEQLSIEKQKEIQQIYSGN